MVTRYSDLRQFVNNKKSEMAVQTYMCFRVTEPRMLQLSGVAKRWHGLLLRALNNDEESLKLVPIEPDYRLQLKNVPRLYSGEEIKLLESNRSFQLTTLPQRIDENYIALTSSACTIILYSRQEAFSNSEK